MTQERFAELLGVSVESIRAWESGKYLPEEAAVIRMADITGSQYIALQYLRLKSEIARKMIPAVEQKDRAVAILQLLKEVNDVLPLRDKLIEIGADGIITPEERPVYESIIKELTDLQQAIVCILYAN